MPASSEAAPREAGPRASPRPPAGAGPFPEEGAAGAGARAELLKEWLDRRVGEALASVRRAPPPEADRELAEAYEAALEGRVPLSAFEAALRRWRGAADAPPAEAPGPSERAPAAPAGAEAGPGPEAPPARGALPAEPRRPPGGGAPLASLRGIAPERAASPEIVRVDDAEGLRRAAAEARAAGVCGIDTETFGPGPKGGLDPHLGRVRLVQIAVPDGEGGVRAFVADALRVRDLSPLRDLLADGGVLKVFHHAKFDLKFLRILLFGGRRPPPVRLFDTMLADQLLACGQDPGRGHSLEACCAGLLGLKLSKEERASDWAAPELSEGQLLYAARDAAVLLPLAGALIPRLKGEGLLRAAALEFGAAPAVAEMEFAGMPFDLRYWEGLRAEEEGAAAAAREALLAELAPVLRTNLLGEPEFNPDSQPQVLRALRALGLDAPDTRDETLRFRWPDHPAVRALLEYRKRSKRISAFLKPYAEKVHPATGRIHASFEQVCRNGVGRMAAHDPNVLQVPRAPEVRRAFAAPEGRALVIADYSQIELRVIASFSRDPRMLEAYRNGEDLHRLTAALVNGVPPERVTKEMRRAAKAVNFGFCFGMSAGTFQVYAKTEHGIDFTPEQSEAFREAYFRAYTGVAAWQRRQKAAAKGQGYVRTVSGRKRKLPGNFSPTLCYNTPVQGTAADVAKRALALLYGELFRRGMEEASIVNAVHDEFLLECPEGAAPEAAALLRECMEAGWRDLMGEDVPMEAEASIGRTWADKE